MDTDLNRRIENFSRVTFSNLLAGKGVLDLRQSQTSKCWPDLGLSFISKTFPVRAAQHLKQFE
jgi:hypothetical protein